MINGLIHWSVGQTRNVS